MKQKLVIFGPGEIGDIVRYYFEKDGGRKVVAFTADAAHLKSDTHDGLPAVAFEDLPRLYPPAEHEIFVAIAYRGMNHVRAAKCAEAKAKGYRLASYVSPRATVWDGLHAGPNTFIFENNVIQPFVTIGENVIMWSGNHIGHHSKIGDHCFLASHIVVSGGVTIEPYCFIGVNATLRDHITIRRECVIGAGALILKDTEEKQVYIGSSAKLFPKKSDELDSL